MIRTSAKRVLVALAGASFVLAGGSGRLNAQQVDTVLVADSTVQPPVERAISPRGAMLRSFAVWGWGQYAVGSTRRAAIWLGMEGATTYMLVRTLSRLGDARDLQSRAEALATDSLNTLIAMDSVEAERLSDPLVFEQAVSDNPDVVVGRKLVSARTQQRQDWITYALFFTLMSGVDAYVNAHLHDFPTTIASEVRRDGAVSFSVRVPLPPWLGGSNRGPASGSLPALRLRRW